MFESPGLSTATAATEKGTPQAAPRSTFVPGNRSRRTSPRAATASGGQFDETTTIFALFAFAARRTSRSPKRTSPVSVATRSARETSITGRPLRWAPRAPRLRLREWELEREPQRERGQQREREELAQVSASEPPKVSAGPRAAGRSGSQPRCPT